MKRVFAAIALAALMIPDGALAGPVRPVVVELYTSQSCASCVPADQFLARLTKRRDVIALSFSVNYWDILGWKDTLASESATRRQKAYAGVLGKGGVYTPQMIVDGVTDAVGSRTDEVNAAINAALLPLARCDDKKCARKHLPVTEVQPVAGIDAVHLEDGTVRVAVASAPQGRRIDATVWFFTLRRAVTVKISGGENQGKTLSYSNVVQDIKSLGKWNGSAAAFTVSYEGLKAVPQDDAVIIIQQNGYGRVLGAYQLAAVRK